MVRKMILLGLAIVLCASMPMAVLADRGGRGHIEAGAPRGSGVGGSPAQGLGTGAGIAQGNGAPIRAQGEAVSNEAHDEETSEPLRVRVAVREQNRLWEEAPRGLLQRTQAWVRQRFEGLLERLGPMPFMVLGKARFEDGSFQVEPVRGNRWALEALSASDVEWRTDEATVRVVFVGSGEATRVVTWDEFSTLVNDCPETTVHLFGTVEEPALLNVRLIIARVPCPLQ